MTPFLKISTGLFKNKKIFFPENKSLKPTKKNLRILFISWFFYNKKNIYFLDLFSGSGILGFELLSLKIQKVIMIDINKNSYEHLLINKKNLHINTNNFKIYYADSYMWLKSFNILNISLIFFDPPYNFLFIKNYFFEFNQISFVRKCVFFFI